MDIDKKPIGTLMGESISRTPRKFWIRISPWVIMGSLVVMVPIFVYITTESIKSQRKSMELMLSEKGGALIRAFEAGTRTGMMGRDWSGARVQQLIRETADLPDILYILITDDTGTFLKTATSPSSATRTRTSENRFGISSRIRFGQNCVRV